MKEEKPINFKKLAIYGWLLFVFTVAVAIVMWINWDADTYRFQAELARAVSQQQIIYQKADVKDEDVIQYFKDRADEFESDSVHIVIDMDKFGTSKMTITTVSEVPNVIYDSILR